MGIEAVHSRCGEELRSSRNSPLGWAIPNLRSCVLLILETGGGQKDEAVCLVGERQGGREGRILPRVLVRQEHARHDEDPGYADDAE